MKILFILIITAPFLLAVNLVDPSTPKVSGYELSFSDEFSGNSLSASRWKVGINSANAIQGNQHSAYEKENIQIANGILKITSKKETAPVTSLVYGSKKQRFQYSSGAINTDGLYHLKGDFYIEIRCKLPENPGGFIAFWTMPAKGKHGTGMRTIDKHETDFFEFKTNKASASYYRYFSSLWWHSLTAKEAEKNKKLKITKKNDDEFWIFNQKNKLNMHMKMKKPLVDFSKFFTMGFKASKGRLSWHIVQEGTAINEPPYMTFDGGKVHSRINPETKKPFLEGLRPVPDFNNYIIFNSRLSNDKWTGGPIKDDELPSTTVVDYIRVYQRNKPSKE